MTPQPQKKGNTLLEKAVAGLISLAVALIIGLCNTAGNIYKNTTEMKVKMEVLESQQHDATIERNNMRLHMVDQDLRLSRIEELLKDKKH